MGIFHFVFTLIKQGTFYLTFHFKVGMQAVLPKYTMNLPGLMTIAWRIYVNCGQVCLCTTKSCVPGTLFTRPRDTHALVTSWLDYCNEAYCTWGSPWRTHRIFSCFRIWWTSSNGHVLACHITLLLHKLLWLQICCWVLFKVLVLTYNILHGIGLLLNIWPDSILQD